jgi:hypothetical protein
MDKMPPLKPAFETAKARLDINPERPKIGVLSSIKKHQATPELKPKGFVSAKPKAKQNQFDKGRTNTQTGKSKNNYGTVKDGKELNARSILKDEAHRPNQLKDTFKPNANNKDRDHSR